MIVIIIKLPSEGKTSKVMCLPCTKNRVLGDAEPSLPYISTSTEQEFCTCEKFRNVSGWAAAATGAKTGRELLGHGVYVSAMSSNSSSKLMGAGPALSHNCIHFTLTSEGVFQHLTLLVVTAANFRSDFFSCPVFSSCLICVRMDRLTQTHTTPTFDILASLFRSL